METFSLLIFFVTSVECKAAGSYYRNLFNYLVFNIWHLTYQISYYAITELRMWVCNMKSICMFQEISRTVSFDVIKIAHFFRWTISETMSSSVIKFVQHSLFRNCRPIKQLSACDLISVKLLKFSKISWWNELFST